jgi:transposase-like protein
MSCPHCGSATSTAVIDTTLTRMRCSSCGRIVEPQLDGTFSLPLSTRGLPLIDRLYLWWWRRKDGSERAKGEQP